MPDCCKCWCHSEDRANHRAELHKGEDWPAVFRLAQLARWTRPAVDVMEPLHAAVACSQCVALHCPTLLTRTVWDRRESFALTPYSTDHADAKGEGQES